jgi:hypothetical protein
MSLFRIPVLFFYMGIVAGFEASGTATFPMSYSRPQYRTLTFYSSSLFKLIFVVFLNLTKQCKQIRKKYCIQQCVSCLVEIFFFLKILFPRSQTSEHLLNGSSSWLG